MGGARSGAMISGASRVATVRQKASRSSIIIEDAMSKNKAVLELIPPGEILLEEFMKPHGLSQNWQRAISI